MSTYVATNDLMGTLYDADMRATTLDQVMGLSEPAVAVEHDPHGNVTVTALPGLGAPESIDTDDDDELARQVAAQGWTPLAGFTGQHGYRGPVMHPSEFIGGRLAEHILEHPGQYAVATVTDGDGDAYGWVVLHRRCILADEPTRCAGDLVLIYHGRTTPTVACARHAQDNLAEVFRAVLIAGPREV